MAIPANRGRFWAQTKSKTPILAGRIGVARFVVWVGFFVCLHCYLGYFYLEVVNIRFQLSWTGIDIIILTDVISLKSTK